MFFTSPLKSTVVNRIRTTNFSYKNCWQYAYREALAKLKFSKTCYFHIIQKLLFLDSLFYDVIKPYLQAKKRQKLNTFLDSMKTAIYARVSTGDQQTLPMQLEAMRDFVEKRGWTVTKEVQEIASGAGKTRPKRDELIKLAKARKIDAIVVLRLDRWGRSLADVIVTLDELNSLGVVFVSLNEAIDLSTPAGKAFASITATFAEYERSLLSKRVKEGMAYAKKQGKKLGRPATAQKHSKEVERLFYKRKMSKSAISKKLKIGYGSVHRILEKSEQENSKS